MQTEKIRKLNVSKPKILFGKQEVRLIKAPRETKEAAVGLRRQEAQPKKVLRVAKGGVRFKNY